MLKVKLINIGTSQGVIIPHDIVKLMDLDTTDRFALDLKDDEITLHRLNESE